MSFYKKIILSISAMLLGGCAHLSDSHKDLYEQGYRQGVQEQVRQVASELQGGNFPYYHWSSPIVQSVNVPAHISNGVMIPEHNELVIIKPGEWALDPAYPINTQQRKNDDNKQISPVDSSDITALPASVGRAR